MSEDFKLALFVIIMAASVGVGLYFDGRHDIENTEMILARPCPTRKR